VLSRPHLENTRTISKAKLKYQSTTQKRLSSSDYDQDLGKQLHISKHIQLSQVYPFCNLLKFPTLITVSIMMLTKVCTFKPLIAIKNTPICNLLEIPNASMHAHQNVYSSTTFMGTKTVYQFSSMSSPCLFTSSVNSFVQTVQFCTEVNFHNQLSRDGRVFHLPLVWSKWET
jgi:hypothetical protein